MKPHIQRAIIIGIGVCLAMSATTKQVANCAFVMAFYLYVQNVIRTSADPANSKEKK